MLTLKFNSADPLTTPRFVLRAPVLSDAAAVSKLRSDPLVNRFLHRSSTTTVEEAIQFLQKIIANNASHQSVYWVIAAKDTDQLIGTVCFWNIVPALDEAEVGYELRSEFFRQGVMQEVLPVVIRFGFEEMGLQRITALPFGENERSVKLLERHHFTLDEGLKQRLEKEDDITGILCYSLVK
jgi:ribosomal-protein-alanine N-acetyltransferase